MQCVILAGGRATRMRPLTDSIPKALIPAAGRPFIDHQLDWLAGHGVTDIVLSVGYRGDAIRAQSVLEQAVGNAISGRMSAPLKSIENPSRLKLSTGKPVYRRP